MSKRPHFTPATFDFLRELRVNNNRDWFIANKSRYEEHARDPMLRFIGDFAERLERITPHLRADPRPVGGSLYRIYRDTRFSRDKTPYKTMLAAHFRHGSGKDSVAPGFYLHLEPDNCFSGSGLYQPESATLTKVRQALVDKADDWSATLGNKRFRTGATLWGEQLKKPPRGFPADHPHIEDLKRKHFIAVTKFEEKEVCAPGFLDRYTAACEAATPLVRFLTVALGEPWE
jgi:uncharacterized protein (TIGR02453 family)